jgi:hypothetical protein
MDNVADILRSLAASFADLANEYETQKNNVNARLTYIEEEVDKNRTALKNAASLILNSLD